MVFRAYLEDGHLDARLDCSKSIRAAKAMRFLGHLGARLNRCKSNRCAYANETAVQECCSSYSCLVTDHTSSLPALGQNDYMIVMVVMRKQSLKILCTLPSQTIPYDWGCCCLCLMEHEGIPSVPQGLMSFWIQAQLG
eukprot:1160884-Pelagomonas_calceolata.AAC.11